MIVEIKCVDHFKNAKQVNAILAKHNVEFLKSSPDRVLSFVTYLTFRIKDNTELNKLLLDINENSYCGVEVVKVKNEIEKRSENFLKRFLKKKDLPRKNFIGRVGQYSDCWLFETDTTSYSQQVCAAIDELMGEFSNNGDKFKITIEKLEDRD